jgi:tetratricopeptide (TPR) repeat protein
MTEDIPRMSNYLGQLLINTGRFEEAETILIEALKYDQNSEPIGEIKPWLGYNLALLGKLYIEWMRLEMAYSCLMDGWKETELAWNVNLVPFVRNYLAELYMQHNFIGRDIERAKQLLKQTIDETLRTGFHRSRILALSLLSIVELELGNHNEALAHSEEVMLQFERFGHLPALRHEELLYHRYLVLKQVGNSGLCNAVIESAYNVIFQNSLSIHEIAHRKLFLQRVPLNKNIINEYNNR